MAFVVNFPEAKDRPSISYVNILRGKRGGRVDRRVTVYIYRMGKAQTKGGEGLKMPYFTLKTNTRFGNTIPVLGMKLKQG